MLASLREVGALGGTAKGGRMRGIGHAKAVSCLSVTRGRRRFRERGIGRPGILWTGCAAALAAVIGLALTGCSSPPPADADTSASHGLTIADARAVYASYLTASDTAASTGDKTLGLSNLSDSQWEVVHAQYTALASADTPVPRYRYSNPVFYVPAVTPFGQWFVVIASRAPAAGGPAARTLMLFERSASGEPWTLDGSAVLDQPLPTIARERNGYAIPLFINHTGLLLTPQVVGATQAAVGDEGPGNPAAAVIADGPTTTGIYAAQSAEARSYAAKGLYYSWMVETAPFSEYVLQTANGGALVLYGLYLNTQVEHNALGARGAPIAVPALFKPLLATPTEVGIHGVAANWAYQVAAFDPPAAAHGAKVQIIASGGGPTYGHAW
jgi:hypothetical protein